LVMRALVLEEINVLPRCQEVDTPSPSPGEVLVHIAGAALNRRDVWISRGQYPGIKTPIILGSDGCGTVVVAADGSESWAGKEVMINPSLDWGLDPRTQADGFSVLGLPRPGTFAEYVTVPARNLVIKPPHLESDKAAALPLAGVTAWRALMTRAAMQPGERVLISGIGGGVALFTLQFAVAAKAEVYVTSSSDEKIARAVELGARDGALYSETGWRERLYGKVPGGFDVIVDGAGGDGFGDLARLLGAAGRLVFYGGTQGKWPRILPQHLFFRQVTILASTMGSPEDFAAMAEFVSRHELVPVVDRVFCLEDGAEALAHLERGSQFGKVVLTI